MWTIADLEDLVNTSELRRAGLKLMYSLGNSRVANAGILSESSPVFELTFPLSNHSNADAMCTMLYYPCTATTCPKVRTVVQLSISDSKDLVIREIAPVDDPRFQQFLQFVTRAATKLSYVDAPPAATRQLDLLISGGVYSDIRVINEFIDDYVSSLRVSIAADTSVAADLMIHDAHIDHLVLSNAVEHLTIQVCDIDSFDQDAFSRIRSFYSIKTRTSSTPTNLYRVLTSINPELIESFVMQLSDNLFYWLAAAPSESSEALIDFMIKTRMCKRLVELKFLTSTGGDWIVEKIQRAISKIPRTRAGALQLAQLSRDNFWKELAKLDVVE